MISAHKWKLAALFCAVVLSSGGISVSQAQLLPDPATTAAEQIQQRAEEFARETTPVQTGDPVLTEPLSRADLPPPGGPTVLLKKVVFEPASEFISRADLDAIAAAYVGREVDFSQIASLVRDVNDVYAEKGVVTASAILPPQTLADGTLFVQLVEGKLDAVSVVGERRTRDSFIFNHLRLTRGDNVVDVPAAAQDIAWFNRTHSAQLRMLLEPGSGFGMTNLAIGVTEPPSQLIQFSVDNEGPGSTGDIQGNLSLRGYGLFGIDDNIMMVFSGSKGSRAATVVMDAPVHSSGTRLSLGLTASEIEVVNGAISQLGVVGSSRMATLSVTQPLFANSRWLLSAVGSGSYGSSQSLLSSMNIANSHAWRGNFGVALSYIDEKQEYYIRPQLSVASVYDRILGDTRNVAMVNGFASAAINLPAYLKLNARGAWQYTNEKLLPGNLLFQIGGPFTVRGYPSNGLGGDSGYYVQAESHVDLGKIVEGMSAFAFTDFGEVFSTFAPRTTLHSAGLGARYHWNQRIILDVTAAFPVRHAMPDQSDFAIYARLTGRVF